MTDSEKRKPDQILSFRSDLFVDLSELIDEFRLIRDTLPKTLTPEIANRIGQKSGSHLLKFISPRADGSQACLIFQPFRGEGTIEIWPSTNAPDIPFAKVLFRPIGIEGHTDRGFRCVIDEIIRPDSLSEDVLDAFKKVFGQDVFDAIRDGLLSNHKVRQLPDKEFPIVFVPNPFGGDLQITPVSPAASIEAIYQATGYFRKKEEAQFKVPPRKLNEKLISDKPQNVSGKLHKKHHGLYLLGEMPEVLSASRSEMFRYIHGGKFPRWRDPAVVDWTIRYADMLDREAKYSDMNTRKALRKVADVLIDDARTFIEETNLEAMKIAASLEKEIPSITVNQSAIVSLILHRHWGTDHKHRKAKVALHDSRFTHRLRCALEGTT